MRPKPKGRERETETETERDRGVKVRATREILGRNGRKRRTVEGLCPRRFDWNALSALHTTDNGTSSTLRPPLTVDPDLELLLAARDFGGSLRLGNGGANCRRARAARRQSGHGFRRRHRNRARSCGRARRAARRRKRRGSRRVDVRAHRRSGSGWRGMGFEHERGEEDE